MQRYTDDIQIPEQVTYDGVDCDVVGIENYAFIDCPDITSVVIPNTVTTIGEAAFSHCTKLTQITIPNSVTTIKSDAFAHSGLISITIPQSVSSYHFAFNNCEQLQSVNISDGASAISSGAFSWCVNLTEVHIPNSVKKIELEAFGNCHNLASLTIPSSVMEIGNYAFGSCYALNSIVIPGSVTLIGWGCFENCSSLQRVEIKADNSTKIDDSAFLNCTLLKTVIIGKGITNIAEEAFAGCGELEDVYCYAVNVPKTHRYTFKDSYIESATLHVPEVSLGKYENATPWSQFGTKLPITDEATLIDSPMMKDTHDDTVVMADGKTSSLRHKGINIIRKQGKLIKVLKQ